MSSEPITNEIKSFLATLKNIGYSERATNDYRKLLCNLERYMVEIKEIEYSPEIGEDFIAFKKQNRVYSKGYLCHVNIVIRRFNDFIIDSTYSFLVCKPVVECPKQFSDVFNDYLDDLKLKGYKDSTIKVNNYHCLKMLIILDSLNIGEFLQIKPANIHQVFEQTSDKAGLSTPARSLFGYLFNKNLTTTNLALFVPSIRKKQPLPSVYTREEVERFLSGFSKETDQDKRDYAIALLALRLGLRSGDIAKLKISEIDFGTKKITFFQEKTDVYQQLELLPEVEEALNLFLLTRPQNPSFENVFLSVTPPITPIAPTTVYFVVRKYLNKANIDTGNRKKGGHSLRMTFASELVSEQVPYDVVRKILGHTDPNVIKHYVKLDIEQLRKCAIKTPPIGGQLESLVKTMIGGAL